MCRRYYEKEKACDFFPFMILEPFVMFDVQDLFMSPYRFVHPPDGLLYRIKNVFVAGLVVVSHYRVNKIK